MDILKKIKAGAGRILMALALCLGLTAGVLVMAPVTVQAGWFGTASEDDAPADYSFYTLASSAASALCSAAGTDDASLAWRDVFPDLPASAAGGFVGFADDRSARYIKGIMQAMTSTSAAEYTFRQMTQDSMTTNSGNHVFLPYMAYGSALLDAGVDGYGLGAETFSMSRQLIGGITMLLFVSAQMIASVYRLILKLLMLLNPFQFFSAVQAGNMTGQFQELGNTGFGNVSGSLTRLISGWYSVLYNMSVVTCVLIIAFFIAGVMFCRGRYRQWGAWRKFLIRIAFIFIGIPLIGGTYTALLERMEGDLQNGNTAAVKVVASTFCDFEGFVMQPNIDDALYAGVSIPIKITNSQVRFDSDAMSVQELCLALNSKATNYSFDNSFSYGTSGNASITQMVENLQAVQDEYPSENLTVWVFDVLGRYMSGQKVRSSSFETAWVATHWANADKADLKAFIECSDSPNDYADAPNYTGAGRWTDSSSINPFLARGSNTYIYWMPSGQNERGITLPADFRLSAMSVYNYLNTRFSPSGAVVYSTERASSDAVRSLHYSVNLAGGGIYGMLLFLSCITLLGTYSIIGFFYSFGIFMTNIKRGIRLIIAVPGAMLGSVQSIAKIISYAVLMILEIVLNIMCYSIFTELLFSLSVTLLSNFTSMLSQVGLALAGLYLMPVLSVFLICFLIWFCIMAVKMRGAVVKSLESMADSIIQKFIVGDTAGAPVTGGSAGSAIAGGALAGAVTGFTSAGSVGRHVIAQSKDTTKQEELISDMFGGGRSGGSAVADEMTMQQRKKIRAEERKEKTLAAFRTIRGGADVAMGTTRVAGGDVTGALQMANGAKTMKSGTEQGMKAGERAANQRRSLLNGSGPNGVPDTSTMGQENKVSDTVGRGNNNSSTVIAAATTAATTVASGGSKEQIAADVAKSVVKQKTGSSGSSTSTGNTSSSAGTARSAGGSGGNTYQGSTAPRGNGGTYNGNRGGGKGPEIDVQSQTYTKSVEDNVTVEHRINRTDKYVQGSQKTVGSPDVGVQSRVSSKQVTDTVNVQRHTNVNEYSDNPAVGSLAADVTQPSAHHRSVKVTDTVDVQRDTAVTESVNPGKPANKGGFRKQ